MTGRFCKVVGQYPQGKKSPWEPPADFRKVVGQYLKAVASMPGAVTASSVGSKAAQVSLLAVSWVSSPLVCFGYLHCVLGIGAVSCTAV
mgnify:CR=1 FL=1